MIHVTLTSFFKHSILVFILSLFAVFNLQAQERTSKETNSDQEGKQIISIDNVSTETEKVSQRIINLRAILEPNVKIKEVDSILFHAATSFSVQRDSLVLELENITRNKLRLREVEWRKYRSLLKDNQDVLNSRTEELSLISDELITEIEKWKLTKESLINNNDPKGVYDSFDNVITTLQEVLNITITRIDSVFVIQKKLTALVLICDEMISEINGVSLQIKKDYFVFDSSPLWNFKQDTINSPAKSVSKFAQIKKGVKENRQEIKEFISLNIKTVVFQIIFILSILALMIIVRKRWKIDEENLINPIEIQAKKVLRHPISSTVVVGVLISSFFYDALIPAVGQIHILFILIATIILLPKLTDKRFSRFLLLGLFVYGLHLIESYLVPSSLTARCLLLLQAALLMFGLLYAKRIMNAAPDRFNRLYKIFKFTAPVYVVILGISLLANIIGMVNLTRFLTFGVLASTILGMVVYFPKLFV